MEALEADGVEQIPMLMATRDIELYQQMIAGPRIKIYRSLLMRRRRAVEGGVAFRGE
jgi:hypothetical protein